MTNIEAFTFHLAESRSILAGQKGISMTQLNDEEIRRLEEEKDERLLEYVKLMRRSHDGDYEAKESAQRIYQDIKVIEERISKF